MNFTLGMKSVLPRRTDPLTGAPLRTGAMLSNSNLACLISSLKGVASSSFESSSDLQQVPKPSEESLLSQNSNASSFALSNAEMFNDKKNSSLHDQIEMRSTTEEMLSFPFEGEEWSPSPVED